MDEDLVSKIKAIPQYRSLVAQRSKLGWTLTAAMLVVYYGYVLLIAFDKDLLASRMNSGVMTWGIPIGLFVIVFTVVMMGIAMTFYRQTLD